MFNANHKLVLLVEIRERNGNNRGAFGHCPDCCLRLRNCSRVEVISSLFWPPHLLPDCQAMGQTVSVLRVDALEFNGFSCSNRFLLHRKSPPRVKRMLNYSHPLSFPLANPFLLWGFPGQFLSPVMLVILRMMEKGLLEPPIKYVSFRIWTFYL